MILRRNSQISIHFPCTISWKCSLFWAPIVHFSGYGTQKVICQRSCNKPGNFRRFFTVLSNHFPCTISRKVTLFLSMVGGKWPFPLYHNLESGHFFGYVTTESGHFPCVAPQRVFLAAKCYTKFIKKFFGIRNSKFEIAKGHLQ